MHYKDFDIVYIEMFIVLCKKTNITFKKKQWINSKPQRMLQPRSSSRKLSSFNKLLVRNFGSFTVLQSSYLVLIISVSIMKCPPLYFTVDCLMKKGHLGVCDFAPSNLGLITPISRAILHFDWGDPILLSFRWWRFYAVWLRSERSKHHITFWSRSWWFQHYKKQID